MKTVKIEVRVPAKGEPPRRAYHNSQLLDMGLLREPRPFREAHSAEVQVLGVPDEIAHRQVGGALQFILDGGGGFPNPCRWSDVVADLARRGREVTLEQMEA